MPACRESDPNHHTLDTLEQCLAIVLDRLAAAESGRHDQQTPGTPAPNKRAPITSLHGQHTFTKVGGARGRAQGAWRTQVAVQA